MLAGGYVKMANHRLQKSAGGAVGNILVTARNQQKLMIFVRWNQLGQAGWAGQINNQIMAGGVHKQK